MAMAGRPASWPATHLMDGTRVQQWPLFFAIVGHAAIGMRPFVGQLGQQLAKLALTSETSAVWQHRMDGRIIVIPILKLAPNALKSRTTCWSIVSSDRCCSHVFRPSQSPT